MGRIGIILLWLFTCDDISIHYLHIVDKCDTHRIVEDCLSSSFWLHASTDIFDLITGRKARLQF